MHDFCAALLFCKIEEEEEVMAVFACKAEDFQPPIKSLSCVFLAPEDGVRHGNLDPLSTVLLLLQFCFCSGFLKHRFDELTLEGLCSRSSTSSRRRRPLL